MCCAFRHPRLSCGLFLLFIAVFLFSVRAWQDSDRVLLEKVNVITLYEGKHTNGRRSRPVPQLQCVGGSAYRSSLHPKVVQCYNKGSDGYDVQWKCNAELDKSVRLGKIQVSCEGYEYPEDPYILRGSCGLEYELDYTGRDGHSKKHGYGFRNLHSKFSGGFGLGNVVTLVAMALFIYIIYANCLAPSQRTRRLSGDSAPPDTQEPPPPYPGTGSSARYRGSGPAPPPYGFKQEYTASSAQASAPPPEQDTFSASGTDSTSGPGFWTGAATGGLLGYLFGRSNTRGSANQDEPLSFNA